MTELSKELSLAGSSAGLVRDLRPRVTQLVEAVVNQIQEDIPSYSGPSGGGRRKLITMAVSAAINHFLDMIEAKPTNGARVDDLFRRMGYGEATDGKDLSSMKAALRIATRGSWDNMRTFATDHDSSATTLGRLGDALFAYVDHLVEQATIGFDSGTKALNSDVSSARTRLLDSLLSSTSREEIEANASSAVWPLPEPLVVMSVVHRGTFPNMNEFETSVLVRATSNPALIVCAATDSADVIEELQRRLSPSPHIALSWPVTIDEVRDARRWATRAHQLVKQGVIPKEPVVKCLEHSTQLWLHAEPALRQKLCVDLLRPLLSETPNSREILAETLLAWLESRDSAPAIAARLNVHPQTVRYRWKRINELFGEELTDPELVVQITMLLKASIPLWAAGDQSDFDLSREQDPT